MSLFAKRINSVLAVGIWAAMVAGCSGGASVGTSTLPPPSHSPVLMTESTKSARGNVRFAIGIKPKAKTDRVAPQYVSPSTQSLQILTDGANPAIINLTPTSPNCSPNPKVTAAYICTASLTVPAGNHVFTVTTYDASDAKGNVLSTNTTGTVLVKPTGTSTVGIVLDGVVQYVVLTVATTNPPIGKAATLCLTAVLEDADQNLIVGPAPYKYRVTLTTTDSTNGSLSKTALNSPADTSGITVAYTGANVASITYSANAIGLSAASVSNAVLTPGAPAQHLYVANDASASVSVFDLANPAAAPTKITGGGLNRPDGVAVDASGKLYVSNAATGSVSVFDTAHGNAVLPQINDGSLGYVVGVAIDARGILYVASACCSPGSTWGFWPSVSIFDTAHGNAYAGTPITGGTYHGTSADLAQPQALAIDASGMLYVADESSGVLVFDTTRGYAELPRIYGLTNGAAGVAADADGKLYVLNPVGGNRVLVFDKAGANLALPDITGGGLFGPSAVAVDASGKLYVANVGGSFSVSVFDTAHGNVALRAITGGGLDRPSGVAVH